MLGQIGWIIISIGVLYLVYQAGRLLKNEADFNQVLSQKKISKIGLSDDIKDIDEYFRTSHRFGFLKKDKDEVKEKDTEYDIRRAVYKKVVDDIEGNK